MTYTDGRTDILLLPIQYVDAPIDDEAILKKYSERPNTFQNIYLNMVDAEV